MESFPSAPTFSSNQGLNPHIQTIRVLVGAPLKRPPKHQFVTDSLIPEFSSIDLSNEQTSCPFNLGKFIRPEGLNDFVVFCTTDFSTISKEVHVRTRRVRLVGLEVFNIHSCSISGYSTQLLFTFYFYSLVYRNLLFFFGLSRVLVKLVF